MEFPTKKQEKTYNLRLFLPKNFKIVKLTYRLKIICPLHIT